MNSKVIELFGHPTYTKDSLDWAEIVSRQQCPYLRGKCDKVRKSEPGVAIGTCTVNHGKQETNILICPWRLIQRNQIFADCIHLLTLHEPGNEFHAVGQLSVPGGSVDYCLASVSEGKVIDFVGMELQTLDTSGTVWPERQRFVAQHGVRVRKRDLAASKPFGMNWKMTAKTTLIQLHHKIATFENIGKHLVLVAQDCLMEYMRNAFSFDHLVRSRVGHAMHFHSYRVNMDHTGLRLRLDERLSTHANGIAQCLGLQVSPNVELEEIVSQLEAKLSPETLISVTDS